MTEAVLRLLSWIDSIREHRRAELLRMQIDTAVDLAGCVRSKLSAHLLAELGVESAWISVGEDGKTTMEACGDHPTGEPFTIIVSDYSTHECVHRVLDAVTRQQVENEFADDIGLLE